jgi:hypothetical protein
MGRIPLPYSAPLRALRADLMFSLRARYKYS